MAGKGTVISVIPTLGRGGAEAVLVAGLPPLIKLGWTPKVVALTPPDDLAADLRAGGVEVMFGLRSLLAEVSRLKRAGEPVILHSHLFRANTVSRLISRLRGVPLVTTLHYIDHSDDQLRAGRIRRVVDSSLLKFSNAELISVSGTVRDDYSATMGVESSVIENPLAPFWLEQAPSRSDARERLGIAPDDLRQIVFACGRQYEQKGFDILGQAAAELPEVRVVIAGREGPATPVIKASGPLELVGMQPAHVVRDWIVAADVVAMPSRSEGFPIFALEAMSMGAAIVASDAPGMRDALIGAARFVEPEDPAALGSALRELLRDDQLRADLASKGRARSAACTPDSWARQHGGIYDRLLG